MNDLFRKAAHTATPANEEPALFTVAFAFGQLLSPSNMTTLPESKQQEYKTVQVRGRSCRCRHSSRLTGLQGVQRPVRWLEEPER